MLLGASIDRSKSNGHTKDHKSTAETLITIGKLDTSLRKMHARLFTPMREIEKGISILLKTRQEEHMENK